MHSTRTTLIAFALSGLLVAGPSHSQTIEEARLASVEAIIHAFTSDPATAIPPLLLQNAKAMAIIPDVIRGGFIFGARRGRGIIIVRTQEGSWSNPSFVTLTGGSFGAQIGADSTDVVLVFGNERSVRDIAEGKFTLGGDAAATAGPIGRNTTATRDLTFSAELYTYVRSRGLFAGATVEGSNIGIDQDANAAFYSADGDASPLGPVTYATPESVRQVLARLENAETSMPLPAGTTSQSEVESEKSEEAVLYPIGTN